MFNRQRRISQVGSGGGAVPVFNFDSALATFTPNMAIRAGALFAGAPMVQGKYGASSASDILEFPRGNQVSGNFYSNYTGYQGSVSLLFTPEHSAAVGPGNMYLWGISSGATTDVRIVYQPGVPRFLVIVGGQSFGVSYSVVAGTTYSLVLRWDTKNTLDGTNYACLSINDSHTFGITSAPTTFTPASSIYVGSRGGIDSQVNARIEALTIYRRPLFDGTYGIDVGNGDEINLIYNSGNFRDPCEVTGSWDVVFCLPTNATPGQLSTGTGHAWSHPHSSNLITPADGFMTNVTAWTNWTDIGTPASKDVLATAEKIFNWGYKFTDSVGGDGVEYTKTVVAGNDWVIRAIVHSASPVNVILYDKSNGAEIGKLTSAGGETRTAPFVAIFTGEAPAGCTSLGVRIQGTVASQVVYCHQVELLANLLTNPSMKSWQGTTPDIPVGWASSGLDTGETLEDTTNYHSGGVSIKLTPNADQEGMSQEPTGYTVGGFHAFGFWHRIVDGTLEFIDFNLRSAFQKNTLASTSMTYGTPGGWTHTKFVLRQNLVSNNYFAFRADTSEANEWNIDDVYSILLTAVSLTVTPASLANSTESGGIRVDGRDTLIQPVPEASISNERVEIRFKYTPRHGIADVLKFGNPSAWLFLLVKDVSNYIRLYHGGASQIRCEMKAGGTTIIASSETGVTGIDAGTEYDVVFVYTKGVGVVVTFNGVEKYNKPSSGSADFSDLTGFTFYAGAFSDGAGQVDAVFAAPA